jgi:endonuclease/exonuclease/phosphatase family metal-dependent hydrolase
LRSSGLFAPSRDRTPTFPASAPSRRIDFVLGPASWTVLDEAVPTSTLSDHLPVVTRFALPAR